MNKYYILYSVVFFIFTSCNKDKTSIDNTNSGKEVAILVNLLGVELENENIAKLGASNNRTSKPKVISASTITMEDGMEAMVSLEEEPVDNLNQIKFVKNGDKIAATTPMSDGVAYVVVFYDLNVNHIVTVNTTSKATATTVQSFVRDTKYKWFAYSFNNNNALTLNSTATPTVASVGNSGLLYAAGIITTSNTQTQNRVNILFIRKTALIEFVVDGRGIFDRLTNLAIQTTAASGLKSGTFNLKTGKYDPSSYAAYTSSFLNSNFTQF